MEVTKDESHILLSTVLLGPEEEVDTMDVFDVPVKEKEKILISKYSLNTSKLKRIDEYSSENFADYFHLRSLFESYFEEIGELAWTVDGVKEIILVLTKYSYLGAFKRYFKDMNYNV
jgi:hypothetical protein